jgi:hypothetical protein
MSISGSRSSSWRYDCSRNWSKGSSSRLSTISARESGAVGTDVEAGVAVGRLRVVAGESGVAEGGLGVAVGEGGRVGTVGMAVVEGKEGAVPPQAASMTARRRHTHIGIRGARPVLQGLCMGDTSCTFCGV